MTLIIPFVVLAVVAYALTMHRRRLNLKGVCTGAFERCYASTLPKPAFEMAWSYGEPVFQVAFASKADMQGAADANAAFLRDIDELCKDRGRRRQFKAQRAVFFQHPAEDEPVQRHCCEAMRAQVDRTIAYSLEARAYGLKTSKVGTPPLAIAHCPWCGSGLPPETPSGA